MQHPEFGEMKYDSECEGYTFHRKFEFLSQFIESDRDPEYVDEAKKNELEDKLKDLFDKSPEEIETEGVPDEFKQTPLAFILPNVSLFEQLTQDLENINHSNEETDDTDFELDERHHDEETIRNRAGFFQIVVNTDSAENPPSQTQLATLEKFFQNEPKIGQTISNAIFRYYRDRQQDDPDFFDIKVDSPEDQVGLLIFSQMTVHSIEIDGEVLLGFHFDAEWEPEHGLGVSVHKGQVLDVGGWEVAVDGPGGDWTPYYKLSSEEDQQRIDRVCQVLQAEWNAQEQEQQKDPYYQLVTAFHAGDLNRVRQLQDGGIDINRSDDRHPPLLYLALHHEIDPEAHTSSNLEQLIELGADPRVKVAGKTIVVHAEEMLANLEFSQKFLNSKSAREMHRLMQTQLGSASEERLDPARVVNQQVSRMEQIVRLMQDTIDRM